MKFEHPRRAIRPADGVATALAVALMLGGAAAEEDFEFFENKVRPVLAEHCFPCHSAEAEKVGGGLKLDTREDLLKGGTDGVVVVAGDPAASPLIRAIGFEDPERQMPPPKKGGKKLPDAVIADLTRWVEAGAAYPATPPERLKTAVMPWSFAPLTDPPPPLRDDPRALTPVDAFILADLAGRGLRLSPRADKRTLIRRASYDLTGLPPTPDEIDAFLADGASDAFAKVVERLLDSPRYGEHWGRHWLDVARYADTAGDTADYPVPEAWRYRNYVIDAFNADKPYDEFLREQIAGDILAREGPPGRYAERVAATGYLALSRRFGFDSENYQHLTIQDTLDTLGQSVLGLSVGCARCHDHKFDPVSMEDYYGLYGIFASTRYAFPGSEQKMKYRAMTPLVPPAESREKWREMQAGFAALGLAPASVLRSLDEPDGDFEMQKVASGGSNGVLVPPWLYEGKVSVSQDAQSPFKHLHPFGIAGARVAPDAGAYRIRQGLPMLPATGVLNVNLEFRVAAGDPAASGRHRFALGPVDGPAAIEAWLSSGQLTLSGGEAPLVLPLAKPGEWHCLQLAIDRQGGTFSGSVGLPGSVTEFGPRRLAGTAATAGVTIDSSGAEGRLPALDLDHFGIQETPIAPVSTTPPGLPAAGPTLAGLQAELDARLAAGPVPLAYGVSEGTPHAARIQIRGEPDKPGAEVPRSFIRALGQAELPAGVAGSGRLELAHWLTRPDHPLTARVMVNRIWQYHFGRGLVATSNDFGNRSQPPSHPELLDHLATRFIASGWSVKAMHRLILASATWQQAGGGGSPQAADFLAAFPRRRLGAEEIRDSILSVSGSLDPAPGGAHPFPPAPGWGYTQHGPFTAVYEHDQRSVYLMVQRIKRHPFLALFDGADPNSSTAERRVTTVPTQALYFLNDPFVHAKAQKFAGRLQAAAGDEPRQIELATRLAFGRPPTDAERAEAADFLQAYRAELGPAAGANGGLEPLAAYLRVLFGSNEFLHCD